MTILKQFAILSILATTVSATKAQNPIINHQFSADPTARVFNGRIYLFPSHDIISPVEPEKKWFSMADYHVFSSDNLTDWTDHGVILSQEQVPSHLMLFSTTPIIWTLWRSAIDSSSRQTACVLVQVRWLILCAPSSGMIENWLTSCMPPSCRPIYIQR